MTGLWRLGRPTTRELLDVRDTNASAELTYVEVGAALGATPDGMHRLDHRRAAGSGGDAFEAGKRAIEAWAGHRHAGIVLAPELPPLVEGETMAFAVPVVPAMWVIGSCRIVAVIDEPDRYGFVYGTLPAHVESGEEAFLVERRPDGSVGFRITAVSRPASLVLRIAGPLGRIAQRWFAWRYVRGFERHVARSGG